MVFLSIPANPYFLGSLLFFVYLSVGTIPTAVTSHSSKPAWQFILLISLNHSLFFCVYIFSFSVVIFTIVFQSIVFPHSDLFAKDYDVLGVLSAHSSGFFFAHVLFALNFAPI